MRVRVVVEFDLSEIAGVTLENLPEEIKMMFEDEHQGLANYESCVVTLMTVEE